MNFIESPDNVRISDLLARPEGTPYLLAGQSKQEDSLSQTEQAVEQEEKALSLLDNDDDLLENIPRAAETKEKLDDFYHEGDVLPPKYQQRHHT